MSLDRAACIDDLRAIAKARIPRFAFDLVDGGAEDESNLRRNREAFEAIRLVPRYLQDVTGRSFESELFGQPYGAPFGIAPIGLLNIFWPGADLMLARLAAEHRFPAVASAAASTTLEEIAEAAQGYAWFQLYASQDDSINEGLLGRAEKAGYETLIVTIDVPVPGKRDRDTRNGLQIPFRISPAIALDLARNPRWCLATLRAGKPDVVNYKDLMKGAQSMAEVQATLISGAFDRAALERVRERWRGRLLVKGILHPADAQTCIDIGCDGVVVSNHGGRQVAFGPASIEVLPAVVEAVGKRVPVVLDSGIRRGVDIIRAKALGADFVLIGRAFGYGAGAGGMAGVERAYEILTTELSRAQGQLGRPRFTDIDASVLADGARARSA